MKRVGKILSDILIVILIGIIAVSGFKLVTYYMQTKKTIETNDALRAMVDTETQEETEDPEAAMRRKYKKFIEANKDFIGWLKIEGTGVDYPVLYTPDDPQHYLRKDFYGNYDIGGSLFMDYRCDPKPGSVSDNIIIYGHRMNNETMFGPLKHYKDNAYAKEHLNVQFDTIYRPGKYKVFAVFLVKTYFTASQGFRYYDFINAGGREELKEYLSQVKNLASYYDEDSAPRFGDEFITLSTCDYFATNGRLVVLATRVD